MNWFAFISSIVSILQLISGLLGGNIQPTSILPATPTPQVVAHSHATPVVAPPTLAIALDASASTTATAQSVAPSSTTPVVAAPNILIALATTSATASGQWIEITTDKQMMIAVNPSYYPFPQCYYEDENNGSIYLIEFSNAPQPYDTFALVNGADAPSFVDMTVDDGTYCFGKDKNHVYYGTSTLSGLDPTTFTLLSWLKGDSWDLFQNGTGIVAFRYDTTTNKLIQQEIPNGDAATFTELPTSYELPTFATDKNNVYCDDTIIEGADPATATTSLADYPIQLDDHLLVQVDGVLKTYDTQCRELPNQ